MRYLTLNVFLLLGLSPGALEAQSEGGVDVLTGRVTDLTGKPIADAQVGATSLGSGRSRTYTTDSQGRYRIYFPETARQYVVLVKRMGFAPAQRTITRRTNTPEEMTIDMQLGGTPLALSMVEIEGNPDAAIVREQESKPIAREREKPTSADATVPNPIAEILALKDTLHLSAVQVVALTEVADTLQAKNSALYNQIRILAAKSQQSGDVNQMAGTIALILQEASTNTHRAVAQAEKLLRADQWLILPEAIRGTPGAETIEISRQN